MVMALPAPGRSGVGVPAPKTQVGGSRSPSREGYKLRRMGVARLQAGPVDCTSPLISALEDCNHRRGRPPVHRKSSTDLPS